LPEPKPLRWSFLLTIPIVVAAIWGVMLALAHVERRELIQVLTTRISGGSVEEARAALDQIVRMPGPPLEVLVVAAASPTREVAQCAQTSISELLRKWRRQLRANRRGRYIAHQLELLAAELDVDRESFSTRDYPWLAKTTESIVRLANRAPPSDAPGLAVHCESLLALTCTRTLSTLADVVPAISMGADSTPDGVFDPPTRIALQSIVPDDRASYEQHEDVESLLPPIGDGPPDLPLSWSQPHTSDSPATPLPPSVYRRRRAEAPAAPPIPTVIASPVQPLDVAPWANIDSRTLLGRWLVANGASKPQMARELEQRGFGSLRTDLARLALSSDTKDRVELVHDLLSLRGTGTKAWLLLFAHDPNAEVRFAAVTVMATSRDPELLEAAWQLALHDRDPQVASLAERLRERQGSTRR